MDTNVLVRYLVQDAPKQSTAASTVFELFTAESPGYVSVTVLVETFWVLKRAYKVSHEEIAGVLSKLASSCVPEVPCFSWVS